MVSQLIKWEYFFFLSFAVVGIHKKYVNMNDISMDSVLLSTGPEPEPMTTLGVPLTGMQVLHCFRVSHYIGTLSHRGSYRQAKLLEVGVS
jgi:hypothetical protein